MIWIKSANVYPQVVENKYQPGIPEREALQDWDLREVVSFKFIFIFFSDPFTDLFDFPINSRYQDLDLNKEIFHKFCFTAMILMLTFMMWNDSRLKAHSLTWRGRQRLSMAKPVAVRNHHTRQLIIKFCTLLCSGTVIFIIIQITSTTRILFSRVMYSHIQAAWI